MAKYRHMKWFFVTLAMLCAAFVLFEFAFWTLPQFEDARARTRLSRIAGVGILHHLDNCGVWLMRPVRQQDVEALGEGLSHLPDIDYLSIGSQCSVTPDGYAALTRAKSIRLLKIHDQALDADQMRSIATIPGLRTLWLQDTGFTGGSLARLSDAQELHSLVIQCESGKPCGTIDEDDIDAVAQLPSLKELVLVGIDLDGRLANAVRARRNDVEIRGSRP